MFYEHPVDVMSLKYYKFITRCFNKL